MGAAVHEMNLEVHALVACHNARFRRFLNALADRVCEFFGNDAAHRFVEELVSFAGIGFDFDDAVTVLSVTARLSDKLAFGFCGFGDCFFFADTFLICS